jgi:hypothetical protein
MIKMVKLCAAILLALFIFPNLSNCGTSAAPNILAEVPTPVVLKFATPDQLLPDIPESAAVVSKVVVADGGEYSVPMVGIGELPKELLLGLELFVEDLNALQIPRDEDVTTFEGLLPCGDTTDYLWNLRELCPVKISFADADLDGNGQNDGCSGNTLDPPICTRAWVNGDPYLSWKFITEATEELAGAGTLTWWADPSGGAKRFVYIVDYDHRQPEDRFTEFFFQFGATGTEFQVLSHNKLEQDGPDGSATIFIANSIEQVSPQGLTQLRMHEKYKQDDDLWSGSLTGIESAFGEYEDDLGTQDFENVCTRFSTGDLAEDQDSCTQLGISVGEIDFLTIPDESIFDVPPSISGGPDF